MALVDAVSLGTGSLRDAFNEEAILTASAVTIIPRGGIVMYNDGNTDQTITIDYQRTDFSTFRLDKFVLRPGQTYVSPFMLVMADTEVLYSSCTTDQAVDFFINGGEEV